MATASLDANSAVARWLFGGKIIQSISVNKNLFIKQKVSGVESEFFSRLHLCNIFIRLLVIDRKPRCHESQHSDEVHTVNYDAHFIIHYTSSDIETRRKEIRALNLHRQEYKSTLYSFVSGFPYIFLCMFRVLYNVRVFVDHNTLVILC